MGTYLSTPILDKCQEKGEELDSVTPVAWGVVDMQGWRKSMEDAHVARTDVSRPSLSCSHGTTTGTMTDEASVEGAATEPAKVFAVFDGHGGPEVARLCQLYLVDVLTNQSEWKEQNPDVGTALVNCFHAIDRMVDDPNRREEILNLRIEKPAPGSARSVEQATSQTAIDESHFTEEKKVALEDEVTNEIANGAIVVTNVDDSVPNDDDSDTAVGSCSDCQLDDDDNDNDIEDYTTVEKKLISSEDAMTIIQKLLNIRGAFGNGDSISEENDSQGDQEPNAIPPGPSAAHPTRIQNGRKTCNLPEHPIHAGCTAICAVIVDKTLTVANCGDSRAVLCRAGGFTEPLSFDHKPQQDKEMLRITEAGGFVNQFGRVNGNLNLSRSIGDLKYKQVPGIPPANQMITAEPDIMQVILRPGDEFLILACDGIWDCLTNEEAVQYVRSRIDLKSPTEIGVEMLDEIVSADPRASQGIGGDNMTVMIIDFLPQMRSYWKEGVDTKASVLEEEEKS